MNLQHCENDDYVFFGCIEDLIIINGSSSLIWVRSTLPECVIEKWVKIAINLAATIRSGNLSKIKRGMDIHNQLLIWERT